MTITVSQAAAELADREAIRDCLMRYSRGIDRADLQRKLLELLLYERGLRDKRPDEVDDAISISPWLTEGLLESFYWRAHRGDRELYQALFARNAPIARTEKPRQRVKRPASVEAATTAREYLEGGGKKPDLKYDLKGGYFRVRDAAPASLTRK